MDLGSDTALAIWLTGPIAIGLQRRPALQMTRRPNGSPPGHCERGGRENCARANTAQRIARAQVASHVGIPSRLSLGAYPLAAYLFGAAHAAQPTPR
jgi:hypothetical protein